MIEDLFKYEIAKMIFNWNRNKTPSLFSDFFFVKRVKYPSEPRASADTFLGRGGGNGKEDRKVAKIPKNSKKTLKNSKKHRKIPCMKIQGGHGPPAFRCRRP